MKIKCPAKINLFLNVLGIKGTMHELCLINQTISLYDEIELIVTKNNSIEIVSKDNIPLDETNSIYKAAKLFKETYNIKDGLLFKVKKKIPISAGLGGESTDAAGTLLLLNEYYKLNKSKEELSNLGIKIGSDIPFFIHSGYKEVRSIGDIISNPSISNPFKWYIIIKPDYGLSTKEMYNKIDSHPFKKIDINKMPYNDFMKVVPESINKIKDYLNENNINNHTLSGSGSAYYIALDKRNIHLYKKIKEYYNNYKVLIVNNSNGFIIENKKK